MLCGHGESSAVLGCSKDYHGVQVTGGDGPTVPSLHKPDRAGQSALWPQ